MYTPQKRGISIDWACTSLDWRQLNQPHSAFTLACIPDGLTSLQKQWVKFAVMLLVTLDFVCWLSTTFHHLRTVTSTVHTYVTPLASLCTYQISRILRSSSEKLFKIPKHNIKCAGEHSFSVMPLCLSGIRHLPVCRIFPFKAQLKTVLFR